VLVVLGSSVLPRIARWLWLTGLLAGCATAPPAPTPAPAPTPVVTVTLPQALAARLRAGGVRCGDSWLDSAKLAAFYSDTPPVPRWVTTQGPTALAGVLRAALQRAPHEGLPPRYRVNEIERYWDSRDAEALACLELLLSDGYRRYSRDLASGYVDSRAADPTWYVPPPAFDPVAALTAANDAEQLATLLAQLPPPHDDYLRLRSALAHYEALVRRGGWPILDAGPKLEPGVRHPQVAQLRARLIAEDKRVDHARDAAVYDATLVAAVRRFQRRHGLLADGVIGARTRAALNVPAAARAAQLRRTLERWRWLPRQFGDRYLWVNTAGFELREIESGQERLRMRAIVGTVDQATPSFSATARTLIINPYWNVPTRIARDKLFPRQRRNPTFFAGRGFRVLQAQNGAWREIAPAAIDWTRVSGETLPYRLRQDPGPKNSMGRLALALPNPFDVFLHNTPEPWLFARDQRTYSEGCVRIEHAEALALRLLRGSDWDAARLDAAIESLQHQTLTLPAPVPVYVLYLTSWVEADGTVQFRPDVYGRESVLAEYFPAQPTGR
jgi:murein L,D-transpeptidase YcbB/YkuD